MDRDSAQTHFAVFLTSESSGRSGGSISSEGLEMVSTDAGNNNAAGRTEGARAMPARGLLNMVVVDQKRFQARKSSCGSSRQAPGHRYTMAYIITPDISYMYPPNPLEK
jgi:hypothetical protein